LSIRPTVTKEELHASARGRGFSIPAGSQEETDFLLLQNSFDAVASAVAALPEYIDSRVEPTPVEGGERKWSRPTPEENLLNAWSHKVRSFDVQRAAIASNISIRQI
jgi:amidase